MKKISWVFLCLVLGYFFTTILVGCGGGGSGGGAVSAISGANPLQDIVTNDSKTSTITINSKGKANSVFNAVAGLMTLEVSEENTLNPEAVIKISETLSNGSENPLLTSGSVIYTINPVKNDLPIKLTTKPLKLTFTNEDKLSKAQSYYIGIKEIDGGKWQFASLYAANSSSRASIGPKGPFEFNLYKENVYVALFADLNNSAKDLSRVLGINASMSASVVHSYNAKYTEDIKINVKLSGDNLGKLKADDISVKVGFGCQDKNTSSRIGIDGGTAKYPICDSVNKYELAGENFAHYYKFSPLSTNFKSQSVPEFSFDLNLKGTPLPGFSNDFVVEISNANDNALPFCYFYPVHFDVEEKEPDSEDSSKPDEETKPDDETKTDDNTQPSNETKPSDDTKPSDEKQPEEEPQVIIPANVSLKSSADDFKVFGDKIVLEFDKDIPWAISDRDKISIDNGAFVSRCEYSNKILSLSLNSRLKYDTDYKVSVKDLKYVKDSNFTFKTERKARVSLKSPSAGLSIASGVVELEFSKDILWNQNYSKNITIDNNAEISDFSYNNKVLKIYLKNNLLYNSHYIIKIVGIDAVEDNDSLEFSTEEKVATPVITADESSIASELPGFYNLKPVFVVDFGKNLSNKVLALSKIKFNDNDLPQSCNRVFKENNHEVVVSFTEDLEVLSTYKLCINSFSDDDGALIASSSDFVFKTIPSDEIRGSGTEEDPFQIYTEAHLRKLNETQPVNYREGGYYFKQMNDIVLKSPWVPIGTSYDYENGYYEEPFIGFYDGGGYSISGLRHSSNNENVFIYGIGLFGYIENSKIKNLNLSNVEISVTYANGIGTIAGGINNSEIENINVCGNIDLSCDYGTGGLVGWCEESTINRCSVLASEGLIHGINELGGLAGNFIDSVVTNSFANIRITGGFNLGGLCGYMENTSLSNCYANSSIDVNKDEDGTPGNIGGLIGFIDSGNINNCYTSGNILIKSNVVTFVGTITGYRENFYYHPVIENTFSSSGISVENLDSYEFDGSTSCYNPENESVPLWWLRLYSNYNQCYFEYNESGSNYAGNGYKSQLNWDSNIWLNLTEGQLPKLVGFQNQ